MAVNYSTQAINDRLLGVIAAIDNGGNGTLQLMASNSTIISSISLANPCGTVNAGVLTFTGQLLDPSAANTGTVAGARILDGTGANVITGLTVGIPLSGCDILISNGLNSTLITAGQVVSVLSAQITGS